MIPLKQDPPAPIASITLSKRVVTTGVLGHPVVSGMVSVADLHGQIVLQWYDDDIDQTLHDMSATSSFDAGGIDFEVMPHEDGEWLTVEATEDAETRHVKATHSDYFDLVAEAMADNAAWSQKQPEAHALQDHRRGI